MIFIFAAFKRLIALIIALLMSSCGAINDPRSVDNRRSVDLTNSPNDGQANPRGTDDAIGYPKPSDGDQNLPSPVPQPVEDSESAQVESQLNWNGSSFIGNSKLAIIPVE